jgi:hypothetical protein
MPVEYYAQSYNKSPIDSPFAKMLPYFGSISDVLGIPPVPTDADVKASPLYEKAANIFQLDGQDSEFTANRIRHLDFAARNSVLADRINWKSSTADSWNQIHIYDQPYGVTFSFSNSGLQVTSIIKSSEALDTKLNWAFSVYAVGDIVTIADGQDYQNTSTIESGSEQMIVLSDSGYSVFIKNSLNAQQTATGIISVKWPYSGDLVKVQSRILAATDFMTQLLDSRSDLSMYFNSYSLPEDTIAASLLALDSI